MSPRRVAAYAAALHAFLPAGCAPKVPGGTDSADAAGETGGTASSPTGGMTTASPIDPQFACERPVEWSRRFGGLTNDTVQGLAVDAAGNIFLGLDLRNLSGETAGVQFGDFTIVPGELSDIVFVKLSPDGEALWARQFGGPGEQYLSAFAGCGDGVVFHAGADPGTLDLGGGPLQHENVFAALDGDGKPRWSRSVPAAGDTWLLVTEMVCDAATKVAFTGSRSGDVDLGGGLEQGSNGFVARFDAAGSFLWSHDLGDPQGRGYGITLAPNGDIAVVATMSSDPLGAPILLARFDTAGNELWRRGFGAPQQLGGPRSIAIDNAGRIAFGGTFRGTLTLGVDNYESLSQEVSEDIGTLFDGFLAQTDPDGELEWSLHLASTFVDEVGELEFDGKDILLTSGQADDLFVLRAFVGPKQIWSWCSPKFSYQVRTARFGDDAIILAPWSYEGDLDLGAGLMPSFGDSDIVVAKLRR